MSSLQNKSDTNITIKIQYWMPVFFFFLVSSHTSYLSNEITTKDSQIYVWHVYDINMNKEIVLKIDLLRSTNLLHSPLINTRKKIYWPLISKKTFCTSLSRMVSDIWWHFLSMIHCKFTWSWHYPHWTGSVWNCFPFTLLLLWHFLKVDYTKKAISWVDIFENIALSCPIMNVRAYKFLPIGFGISMH